MEIKGDKGQMFQASKNFTDLIAWKKAHEFVLEVYAVTKNFPAEERFALCPNSNEQQFLFPQI